MQGTPIMLPPHSSPAHPSTLLSSSPNTESSIIDAHILIEMIKFQQPAP